MRTPLAAILIACLTGCAAQPPSTDGLLALNRQLFETPMLEQSADLLLQNSVAEYVVVGPGGVVESREQVVAGLGAFAALDSISISDEVLRASAGVAVVTNRLRLHGSLNLPVGPLGAMTVASTYVWVDGRWLAVSRTTTPCNPRAADRGLC